MIDVTRRIGRLRRHSALADLASTVTSNLGIGLLGGVGGLIAARLLDSNGRGELAAATAWAFIAQAIIQWGVGLTVVYFANRESKAVGSILSATLVILLLQTIILAVVGGIGTTFILQQQNPQIVTSTRLYLATVPFTLLNMYLAGLGQGLGHFRFFNTVRAIPSLMYVLIFIAAWVLHVTEVPIIVAAILVMYILTGLGTLYWFTHRIQSLQRTSRRQIWEIFKYGTKTYIGAISASINYRLDQFVMSLLVSLNQLGIYAVAVSYATLLTSFSNAFAVVMYPRLRGASNHRSTILTTLKVTLISTGVICVVAALTCPILLPLLFGPRFVDAVEPAEILLIGSVLIGANSVLGNGLHALGFALQRSYSELIGVVVTVVGLWLAIPLYGIIGAAVVSLLSYAVVFLSLLLFFYKTVKVT